MSDAEAAGSDRTPGPAGTVVRVELGDDRRLPRWVWRLILAVAVSVALFQATMSILDRLTSLLWLVGIALFLSFAVEPAVNRLAEKGWRRGPATLLCFVVVIVASSGFTFLMGELVVSQVSDLIDKAPDYLDAIAEWADDTLGADISTQTITNRIQDYQEEIAGLAADVGGRVLSLTGSFVGFVFNGFTILLFAYYMTSQGPQMRRNLCSILPEERQRNVMLLWELAIQKTGGWLYSRLLLALISGTCTWLFLLVLGVPSPLALGLWVGLVSQFIPAIGTYLAGALPVLIALLEDPVDALWVLGFILVYQQIENYLLSPRITSQTMDLHPAVAFGAALGGAAMAGPIGAIIALPAAGVIQAFVSTFLDRHEVIDSHLTEFEEIQQSEGDSAMRRAMRRLLRARPADADPRPPEEATPGPAAETRPEARGGTTDT